MRGPRLSLMNLTRCSCFLLVVLAFGGFLLGQEPPAPTPPVIVGVVPTTNVGVELSSAWEREQLVLDLQSAARNQKAAFPVEVVPLQGTSQVAVTEEARTHQCQFVLFTTVSLQSSASSSATQGGVRNRVGAPPITNSQQLNAQYALKRPGETKALATGTALTPGSLEGYDFNTALRSALRDLAARVVHDLTKLTAPK